jgi:hypothetical protein
MPLPRPLTVPSAAANRTAASLLLLAAACGVLGGCGSGTYGERLKATNERNAYFARLDATLAPYATPREFGNYDIWLRPPQGLRGLFPPAQPKDGSEPPPDPRLEFQGVPLDLPGLITAWEGTLPIAGGGAGTYRLYLLGNHSRFLSGDSLGKPADYFKDLESALSSLFLVTLPDGNTGRGDRPNEKFALQIPASGTYTLPKPYTGVNFTADQDVRLPFQGWLYEHSAGPMQVAVLMLTPPTPSNDVRQALLTSLETLQVGVQPPRAAPAPSGRPSAPSAPGGARPDL